MTVFFSKVINANSHIDVNLCSELDLNSGVKRIAICGNADGLLSDTSNFYLPVPNGSKSVAHYEFPIIDGKSPCLIRVTNPTASNVRVWIIVEELGGLPDSAYFDK